MGARLRGSTSSWPFLHSSPRCGRRGPRRQSRLSTRKENQGWEAVGMTALADGTVAVLLKKPKED
jgi:hypothetical protein